MRLSRTITSLLGSSALAVATLALAPAAQALSMTDDYGVVLADSSGTWDVVANDGDPNSSGFDYVTVTSGPDTTCAWICGSGTSIYVDPSSAPTTPSGVLTIGYELDDGDTGNPIGTAHLNVAVVPDHLDVTSADSQMTIAWPGMPAAIGGLHISYDTSYVGDHTTGTQVTTTGTGSKTITGLTNGTTYYVYATPYYHGSDLEDGCGYPCGLTGQTSPRAVNHPPVAVDDTVSLVDTSTKYFDPTSNDTDADDDPLTITSTSTPAHGTLDCSFGCSYTPSGASPQDDSFTYTISDGYGGSASATVHLVARHVTATNDSASTYVDESTNVDVLANDTGTVADDFVDVNPPTGVDAYWDTDLRKVVVTGVTQGSYVIPYTVYDSDFDQLATANINVTVGPKRPLVANDDTADTDLDVATDVIVAENDYIQAAGFPLSSSGTKITVAPTHGTATLSFVPDDYYDTDTGTYTLRNLPSIHYVPATHFTGTDTVTYQLQDALGHTDTGVLTVTVGTPQPDYLSSSPGIASADLDFGYSSSPAVDDVMACYAVGSDRTTAPAAPTDRATCTQVPLPAGTPTSFHWTGLTNDVWYTVSYWIHSDNNTPNGLWSDYASDSFRPGVESVDHLTGDGGPSNFTVSWTNPSAPQGSTGTVVRYSTTAPPATPTDGAGTSVGSGITTASVSGLAAGTYYVSVFATNTNTYADPQELTLKVAAGNHPPTTVNDSLTLNENTAADVSPLANDSDADGDLMDIKSYTQPAHGFVYCSGDSSIGDPWSCSYEPDQNYSGPDSFTYVAWDHRFGNTPGTVNVQVNQVNTAPQAFDDTMTATTAKATPVDLTQDSFDLENNTLTYTIVTQPTHGTLACPTPNNGKCTYTSAAAYTGADSFVWKATDNGTNPANLSSNNATMSITVVANQPPVVQDQDVAANSGEAKVFSIATGASDPDGDTLTFTKTTDPQKGTVTCTTAGQCTYTANASASGQDSFNFQASDGHGGVATGSVLITITHVNHPPVAGDTSVSTDNATPVVTNVSSLSSDPDGDPLTFSKVSGPTGTNAGTVTCSGSNCTYTPNASFTGTTTYTYQASDGTLSDTGVVTITVTQANRPPIAGNDSGTVRPGQSVVINVAANDSDPDGDALTFAKKTDPGHGTVVCTTAGSCTYTAQGTFTGTDTFDYTVSDGHGHTVTATVTVTVTANHPPTVGNDSLTVTAGQAGVVNVASNDSDSDGDTLTFAKKTDPAHGTVTCTSAGSCTYTSAADYAGSDSFTYTASDGHGGQTDGTVTVTVNPATVDGTATIVRGGPTARSVKTKVTFTGTATPARSGATVQLQRLDAGTWKTIKTATESASGGYSFGLKQPTGSYSYRVFIPAFGGRSDITTSTVSAKFYQVAMKDGSNSGDQWVSITNTGKVAVALKGWTLALKSDGSKLTLPTFTLKPGKTVKVHLGKGTKNKSNLYLGTKEKFSAHDVVKLKDLKPVTVASYAF